MTEKEIRDLFASKNVPLGQKDIWTVQGSLVIKHAALERLAGAIKVRWNPPQVLRADRDEAVILATGYVIYADGVVGTEEWSIGEALVGVNYRVSGKQAAYVYAMAEKRAKDRVILKLANLHGAYSEDEADEFKDSEPKSEAAMAATSTAPSATVSPYRSKSPVDTLINAIQSARTEHFLQAVITSPANIKTYEAASEDDQARISDAVQLKRDDFNVGTMRAG